MRCPKCEQWNRASLPRCIRCGAELKSDTPVEPGWRAELEKRPASKAYVRVDEDGQVDVTPDQRDSLAQDMTDLKVRRTEGKRHLDELKAQNESAPFVTEAPEQAPPTPDSVDEAEQSEPDAPAEPSNPFASMASDAPRRTARVAIHGLPQTKPITEAQPPMPPSGAPAVHRRPTATPVDWDRQRNYDPIVEEMQRKQQPTFRDAPQQDQQRHKGRSRHQSRRRILNFITALLTIMVVALAGAVGYSAYQKYQAAHADDDRAIVTASMKDDQAAHTVLIPGEDGQKIYIRELHATYEVVGGFATIVIPDHTWYENLSVVNQETMTVTLTPSLQTSGARQKALDPISYDITIPLSPITLVTPKHDRMEVTTAMYSMQFLVRPGSTVTINGVDMSDAVDDKGLLAYNATVQPKGDNVYTVNVRSPYCRDNSMEVVLFRQVQEIPLDLAATTYTSTSLNKYQITCTTLPGADVQILTPHSDLVVTDLDKTGEFTFYALFDKIGDNTVSIQATYPGKKTSRVDYVIYYLPSADVYTRKAWSLNNSADYAELMGNLTFRASNTQIYMCAGSFDSFISVSPQMAIMYCSDDGLSQPVLLQNMTSREWNLGTDYEYRIYADVYSSYNGMPWLIARYTYVDKEPKTQEE